MKKILIIGASILQLPAIIRAKELGFHVGTCDYNPNAIGKKYADEFFNVSTVDIDGVVDVAKKYKPDGIMTLATDMPIRSVAAATAALNLPGISIETAIKATDKGEMIKTFKEQGVQTPWFFIINNKAEFEKIIDEINFPCIIKPIDSSGSRGVIQVNSKKDLLDAYFYSKNESRSGSVIVEEFMSGTEVSVEIMVVDNYPHVIAVTDKLTTGAPYFVEMGHSQQSQLPIEKIEKIKDISIKAVKAIGIKEGPAHVEVMLTSEGPKMIELGARLGGDNITTHLVPLSTGIDMIEATIKILTGEKPIVLPTFEKGSAIQYFDVPSGRIVSINGIDEAHALEGVKQITLLKNVGDTVNQIKSSNDRIGFVIAQSDNTQNAIDICKKAIDRIKIQIDNA